MILRILRRVLIALAFLALNAPLSEATVSFLDWEPLPQDFDSAVAADSLFAGGHDGMLFVAGGELPDGMISDEVRVLRPAADGAISLIEGFKLPQPLAGGTAVETPFGLVLVGGIDAEREASDAVILLEWKDAEQLVAEKLPDLPTPTIAPSAVFHDDRLLAVDSENMLYSLNFKTGSEGEGKRQWIELGQLPGPVRSGAVAAVLSDGEHDNIYIFGGRGPSGEWLDNGLEYAFTGIDAGTWKVLDGDVPDLALADGVRWGRSHLLAAGTPNSDDGKNRLYSYHAITHQWAQREEFAMSGIPTALTKWGDQLVTVSKDEAGDGALQIHVGTVTPPEKWFGGIDYTVLGFYLLMLVGIGWWCSQGNSNTGEYFLAGKRIPYWAAALSMMATSVSSIGFIAIPGKTFATNWLYFTGVLTWFVVVPIVAIFFIPVIRKLDVTTAYEYLEDRFNLSVRLFASLIYILMQLGRLAIVLYLPSLVLSSVLNMNIYFCIAVMGVVSIVYTVMGGMKAVIWTDVIQVVVLFGGALLGIGIALGGAGVGPSELWSTAMADGKLQMADWRWDHTMAVVWVVVLGNIFTRFSNMTSDQAIVQRYLTTKNTRTAVKALWGDVAVSIPWALVAFGFGTAIYLFYKLNPALLLPGTEADAVVPVFIAQQMPAGLAGLIISAIFAAAMSSLDSTIHSLSTVAVRDFYGRLSSKADDRELFRLARGLTIFFGLLGTVAAIVVATYDIKSLWDLFMQIIGLFVGSLSGLFALGLFVKSSHGRGAFIGAVASAVIVYAVSSFTATSFFLYSVIGVLSCVLIGYLASLIIPSTDKG